MSILYPFKFRSIFKDKVWGGQKIRSVLGQEYGDLSNCGEAWVISGVDEEQTQITNGFLKDNDLNELVEIYMGELVGDKVYQKFGNEFPILVKFLDTNDWLSIQVHPGDELAAKRHGNLGKTEMWYILDVEEGAELISGFSKKVDKSSYTDHLENKTLKSIMNFEKVDRGDVFFIPAGRVHALGPGILLTEIQQTSDLTYRIYDWDRIDNAGMLRELHTDLALDALDFTLHEKYKTEYQEKPNETSTLVESPYFTTNIIPLTQPLSKDYNELDSFVIYICTEGSCNLFAERQDYNLKMGEAMLIPASMNQLEIYPNGNCTLLEVYMVIS